MIDGRVADKGNPKRMFEEIIKTRGAKDKGREITTRGGEQIKSEALQGRYEHIKNRKKFTDGGKAT